MKKFGKKLLNKYKIRYDIKLLHAWYKLDYEKWMISNNKRTFHPRRLYVFYCKNYSLLKYCNTDELSYIVYYFRIGRHKRSKLYTEMLHDIMKKAIERYNYDRRTTNCTFRHSLCNIRKS